MQRENFFQKYSRLSINSLLLIILNGNTFFININTCFQIIFSLLNRGSLYPPRSTRSVRLRCPEKFYSSILTWNRQVEVGYYD